MLPTWERRSSQRLDVRISVVQQTDDGVYLQRTGNLSSGGLFLEGTMPEPPGTRVKLRFQLPQDPRPIEVAGEILHPKKDQELGMSVRFLELPDDVRERIERFIDRTIGLPFGR